ncbi:MAG: flavodoxin family protein [Deltaproteobacteria bacterium]|jgi:hypothetical protein|nr:flavodoxin family protein [Deltaproteobacteria bacterium]
MTYVIAFSGSPFKDGTIEKGLKMVLEGTGAEKTELVRLSSIKMNVCVGCKKCAPTNRCVMQDDVNPLLEKIEKSDAFILSGYPSFSSLCALTKVFIERNWPLRHNYQLTKGKIGAAVVAGGPTIADLDAYFAMYYEGYLGMEYQGTLSLRGNVPCMTCGYGEDCEYSGFLKQYGPGAKVTPDKFYDPAADPDARIRAVKLGTSILDAITRRQQTTN